MEWALLGGFFFYIFLRLSSVDSIRLVDEDDMKNNIYKI